MPYYVSCFLNIKLSSPYFVGTDCKSALSVVGIYPSHLGAAAVWAKISRLYFHKNFFNESAAWTNPFHLEPYFITSVDLAKSNISIIDIFVFNSFAVTNNNSRYKL